MNNWRQTLSWELMQPNQLSPEVLKRLTRVYNEFVRSDDLWNTAYKYLNTVSRKVYLIINTLTNYRQELGSILEGNIDEMINYYQSIYDDIQNEEWENLNFYDLLRLPSEVEILFDNSNLIDFIRQR